jgi:hypothetical protein
MAQSGLSETYSLLVLGSVADLLRLAKTQRCD